ncbi:hypothetical protein ABK040_000978 [Willaertia magna]
MKMIDRLYIKGYSTLFGTTLNYVSLRLLGVTNEKAGVIEYLQWAKLYLCVLGLIEWNCIDPIPLEL